MFQFFDKIIGFFETAFQFFVNLIDGLISALGLVSSSITVTTMFSGFMPSLILSSFVIVFSISAIKFIVGR